MTYQQIKSFINTYIVQNGVNAITGSQLNTALNELADYKGFDSVFVTTLPAGSDATVTVQGMTLVLGIPKGADGIDGQNAVNPFKGWFTTANIPTTGQEGDYCNVSDTSVTPHTVTIYRWSTAQNAFVDTGEVPDTATGETFASSETLQQVAIDDSHLVNPVNTADPNKPVLAKAEDVMQLKAKLEGVTASEEKIQLNSSNVEDNLTIVGLTGRTNPSGSTKVLTVNVAGVRKVRFLNLLLSSEPSESGSGWAFWDANEDTIISSRWDFDESLSRNTTKEYELEVPSNAVYFKCALPYSYPVFANANFYCYTLSGSVAINDGSDIINDLEQVGGKVLGKQITPIINHRTKYVNLLSKYSGINSINVISPSQNLWVRGTYTFSTLIKIDNLINKKIKVVKDPTCNTHIAFLTQRGTLGAAPAYCNGTDIIRLNDSNGIKELILDIPSDAQYLYVKIQDDTEGTPVQPYKFGPKSIEVLLNEDDIVSSNTFNIPYLDTYIEENIIDAKGELYGNGIVENIYKIDQNLDYRLILYQEPNTVGYSAIEYLDSDFDTISTAYPEPNSPAFTEMQKLNIPNNCRYVRLRYYQNNDGTNTRSRKGIGALMKPLQDDGTMPTNKIVYCVSKIYRPLIPNGYSESQQFEQQPIWSAWGFMMPYGGENFVKNKKGLPICTWFHGSSSCLTPKHLGNPSNNDSTSMAGKIRDLGFIVLDINGYGISYLCDDKARHWGCPGAVETVHKAYEVLVNRFNGRRKMMLGGWSMGGAIAKSYAMIYPEDVVACALFAPSEIGGNCRFNPFNIEVSETSFAHAWGYSTKQEMYADHGKSPLIGYSPCVTPLLIKEDKTLRTMPVDDFIEEEDFTNNNMFLNFAASFPKEVMIWHGTADTQVKYWFSQWFVQTIRNAGGNAMLRTCQDLNHNLPDYDYIVNEFLNYVTMKMAL